MGPTAKSNDSSSRLKYVPTPSSPVMNEHEKQSAASLWFALGPQEFRLLYRNSEEELWLETHDIHYSPPYRVFSYPCGMMPRSRPIRCSNCDGTMYTSL